MSPRRGDGAWAAALLAAMLGACPDAANTQRPGAFPFQRDAGPFSDAAPNPNDPCNGFDDDGDGVVDGPGRCPLIYPCTNPTFCTCARGWSRCSTQCVAEFTATGLCSPCSYACPEGTTCRSPRCVDAFGRAPFPCGAEVVDIASSTSHCGACNRACPADARCLSGACTCPGTGLTACGAECADLRSSPRHCGACGTLCPVGSTCTAGRCVCPTGQTLCSGRCVDTRSDRTNCGSCARACPTNGLCELGTCRCSAGFTLCGSVCTNLTADDNNCGGCGVRCTAGMATCVSSRCRCTAPNSDLCSGVCRDVSRDDNHCGACASACTAGSRCVAGACRVAATWPPSGARLGTRRPEFRWGRGAATVQVCSDRECSREVARFRSTTPRVVADRDLSPGVYFWRAFEDAPVGVTSLLRLDARNASVQGLVPPAVDLDLDGRADLATASPFTGRVRVWFARGDDLSAEAVLIARPGAEERYGFRLQYVGDLDRDGQAELGVWQRTGVDLRQPQPTNDAFFQARVNEARSGLNNLSALAVLDFDRDGTTDLVGGFAAQNTLVVRPFRQATPAMPVMAVSVMGDPASGFGSAVICPGDLDGDNFPDLVVGSPTLAGGGRVAAYLASSAGFDRVRVFPVPPRRQGFGAVLRAAGDVNGDGLADVVCPLSGSSAAVYMGSPDGMTLRTVTGPVDADLDLYSAGDVDGDGYFDLVAVFADRGEAWLWRGSASGPENSPVMLRDPSWSQVSGGLTALGDVDGDGFDDLALALPASNRVRVAFGARTDPFTRRVERTGPGDEEFGASLLGSH